MPVFRPITKILLVICGFLLLFSCAPGKDVSRKLKKRFTTAEASTSWFTGFMVYDPHSRKMVFEHNSHKYFTPASNIKLLSFYAGLKILEDSIPTLKYEVLNDTLYFTPTGDPGLLHSDFDSSKILEFFNSHSETLMLIYPKATETPFGPGWAWDDYNYSFSAERSPFPLYGNTVNFSFSPEDSLKAEPSFFDNQMKEDSTGISSGIERNLKENSFKIPLLKNSAFEQQVPFITSAELSARLLSDTLKRKVNLIQNLPKHIDLQHKLFSRPMDSLYKKMLQDSDNFFAEQLLLMAAGEISDTLKAEIAIDYVQDELFKEMPDEIKWVDGSGLSRYNLLTPRSLVWVLEKIYREVPRERLFALLPAGGVSGSLKNDYKAPAGKPPFVFAKTGTLSNNHSLSGYLITSSGRVLIFSFMNNHYMVPTAVVKSRMDEVLRELYLNY
ncbi:D-alanyl-D-alanine carboxypeptidase/D-alanyl-D-alanine-endopeptidase [Salinimicrobium sp. TH3]|uniref:D-alanyl-D-alanine carboxypeptidase/D-alanyl-D-alanine-endopeptidase n=1 Tax=Salinimicrobium sp. TH3 TaxID=2997342 RepID=UPI00227268F9|nr:D-alanyl-D-alanine carboxypeptidase [Salinimicrobium sp. TH3]MCY2688382.1 D-alanyl-D-alanine carboxypeptidase [Salinimicrobium sp. TH3]